MWRNDHLQEITEAPIPILSVYLNTMNQDSTRHLQMAARLAWFRRRAAEVASTLPVQENKQFQKEIARVEKFLDERIPEERALAIFSGARTWTALPLHASVENALEWGKPAVGQLFRFLTEHPPYGVIVVDHQVARMFAYRLGELTPLSEKAFDIDRSEWKKKDLGHFAGERTRKTRGSNRDLYDHRLEAQYERLCHETAEEAVSLWKKFEFAGLFLVGSERLTSPIRAKLAQHLSPLVFSIPEDLAKFSERSILRRIEPRIAEFETGRQEGLVKQLQSEEGKFVTNLDEILTRLQEGSIHTLVVASDLDLNLHQCRQCGRGTRSADPACASCGGVLHETSLLEMLPVLARSHHTKVEFVSGAAAKLLAKVGGMGGWSRQPKARAAR